MINISIDQVKVQSDRLSDLLKRRKFVGDERADALGHALIDIAESIQKIYGDVIPAILKQDESNEDLFRDAVWELREEFRHVDYHIQDSGVIEL